MIACDGGLIEAHGLDGATWPDDASLALKLGEDGRKRRGTPITHVVLHTTRGIPGGRDQRPQVILPGLGPQGSAAEANARYWSRAKSSAGAHLIVDYDGTLVQTCDLALVATYHAGAINGSSIGIEIVQSANAELYEGQLAATVRLCRWLANYFDLPLTIQFPYRGHGPPLAAFVGHRDLTDSRGRGDPGDAICERLIAAGFVPVGRLRP